MGHATRCMPIINALIEKGVEPILASDGRALLLLQKEYPTLQTIELPAYNVTYQSRNMIWNIAPQIPKILNAIRKEQKVIQQIIKTHQIDAIISDNRFGCYVKGIPSVFITHQVNIKVPITFGQSIINYFNHRFIHQYDICWIPDVPNQPNLAGSLSEGAFLKNHQYIGILSRMVYQELPKKYDIAVVLSGPEPQRTYLEQKILKQLQVLPYKAIVIKGKTDENEQQTNGNITTHSFMTAGELNTTLLQSKLIITRSGYSTLMDLIYLRQKAILIPTPGQTEQEYLAKHFYDTGIFYSISQSDFDLQTAVKKTEQFSGFNWSVSEDLLLKAIDDFLIEVLNRK